MARGLSDEEKRVLKVALRQAYDAIAQATTTLAHCIRADRDYPVWVHHYRADDARGAAIAAISDWYANPELDPNETTRCLGVIGSSAETLAAVNTLNACKRAFVETMKPVSRRKVMAPDPEDPSVMVRTDLARVLLREIHLKGLLQRQLTRQLAIIPETVQTIGFSLSSNSTSLKRISQKIAKQKLTNLGDDHNIRQQKEHLKSLARKEVLVIVNRVPSHARQNVAYRIKEKGEWVTERKQYKNSLPLFYLSDPGSDLPDINEPSPLTKERHRRRYREIEDVAFLPAIQAYRYRKAFRQEKAAAYWKEHDT